MCHVSTCHHDANQLYLIRVTVVKSIHLAAAVCTGHAAVAQVSYTSELMMVVAVCYVLDIQCAGGP